MSRPLATLPADPTMLLPALAAALDGTGPAVLPLPAGPAAVRDALVAAVRPDLPVDEEIALVVPTSGSTGEPKGVMLSAAALRHSTAATLERLGGPGRWLLALPVSHVAGLQVLVRSLLAGTSPEVADGPSPEAFAAGTDRLGSAGRRYTSLVPTQLGRLLASGGPTLAALRSYDAVLLGGAAPPAGLVDRARAAGVRVVVTYGMSETAGGCVYDGVPLGQVQVAVEADGLVRIGGPVLFAGYRLRPDLTAQALVDGWLLTRDLGRLTEDGRLEVLGRVDDVLVSGGVNVPAGAVEALLRTHPGVRDCAVVGRSDPEWGQRVVAAVVPADRDRPPTLADLRAYVRERGPVAYAPRAVLVLDALPLLPSGKVDRAALASWAGRDETGARG